MLGWTVLSHLKQDATLRHIPVQIVTLDENRQHGLSRGAFSFVTKPATTEGLELGDREAARVHHAAAAAAAHRGGQRRRADSASRSCSATTTSTSSPPAPAPAAMEILERGAGGLHGARSAPARHLGLRGAGRHPRRRDPARPAGGGLHRPGADARRGPAASGAGAQGGAEGRGVARAAARRDGALPPPRGRPTCRRTSSGCWRSCTARTRTCAAARCWWWTTTCGTSSPSAACSSATGWTSLTAQTGREAISLLEIHARHGDGADGHHDAGDGRLPDHPASSGSDRRSAACPSSRSPPRR